MADLASALLSIVVEEDFPHSPSLIWRALTDGALMARWIMPPAGFAPVVGQAFTFTTKPAGKWDGTIRCRVLTVEPDRCLAYSWSGGDAGNVGYGSLLSTIVTFTLSPVPGGTRLRLDHAGFEMPRNEVAHQNMSGGWKTVLGRLVTALSETGPVNHD